MYMSGFKFAFGLILVWIDSQFFVWYYKHKTKENKNLTGLKDNFEPKTNLNGNKYINYTI